MSKKSNIQGHAYEFICIETLLNTINDKIPNSAIIDVNGAYSVAKNAWINTSDNLKDILQQSAIVATNTLFDMEPTLLLSDNTPLLLEIQSDDKGKEGDVRDIVVSRSNIKWEIGLSLKHNHFAVKHSRIAKTLDFGSKWYGSSCSKKYWEDISPIFEYLDEMKALKKKWKEINGKEERVYIPLLKAFIAEIMRSYNNDSSMTKRMVEYLLGKFDFYKIISIDSKNITRIQSYNLHGQLNKVSKTVKPKISIPIVMLPNRIVDVAFKPNSTNTVELYMNEGWQFSFRIHNASTYVETSLKFDIQIVGLPSTIITIDCYGK